MGRPSTPANYKHKVISKLRTRALLFETQSETEEEANAWRKLVIWLDSFHQKKAYLTKHGSIGIRGDSVEEL